uniref:ZP domain-containing protein n=1 Tax=Panagrolaimus davidi TaxID=227884 RepID=A0A914QBY0_9BILA
MQYEIFFCLYNLVCRYFAHENSVGTVMEIAPYSKTYLIGDNNTPNCHYSLHINSLGGPTAENAQLGDKVYHEWKCETHTYAIKVYECYVHDGNNRRYMLIDENG